MTTPLELVVLDMAGTTVLDDGVVEQAFQRAAERTGVAARMPWDEALDYVRVTMGQSKIDVFTHLSGGDAEAAARATAAFEGAYAEIVSEQGVSEIPGAADAIQGLKDSGLKVVRTQTSSVHAVAVAGDTVRDVESGRRAGAGFVAGVLTGAHDRPALSAAGADAVLSDVTALRGVLAQRDLLPLVATS